MNYHAGKEVAEVTATAMVTKADGSKHKVSAKKTEDELKFQPYGCLCGGLWLMIENNQPACCPYCGQQVVVEGG